MKMTQHAAATNEDYPLPFLDCTGEHEDGKNSECPLQNCVLYCILRAQYGANQSLSCLRWTMSCTITGYIRFVCLIALLLSVQITYCGITHRCAFQK